MKVQGLNSSSRKTRNLIKKTFAELMNEKKELNKITVTELVKRADITRSTFYTHYDDIYEVVNDYQLETIELLVSDDKVLNSVQDIYDYFDEIFSKALEYSGYCEGQRYLVNNNTFFCNMIVDNTEKTYCADWGRAGIMDYMMDFAILDLNKPYLLVPEKLFEYANKKKIEIKDFKERFLCMAYFKGIDTLRWHASIDDLVSCECIVKSINALEERMSKY